MTKALKRFRALLALACLAGLAEAETAPLKVALYADVGCRGGGVIHWARLLDSSPDVDFSILDCADIRAGRLAGVDVLVMPGGGGFERYDQWKEDGCDRFRDYLRAGGRYFGTCCGLAVALNEPRRIRLVPFKRDGHPLRGGFNASVRLLPRAAELLGVPPATRSITYHNGPVPVPADPLPDVTAEVIATYDCTLMERGRERSSMHGHPAIIWSTYGKGRLLSMGVHPEYAPCNHDLIVGGLRALTGRAIAFPVRKKKTAPLRVAFYASELDAAPSCRALVKDALRIVRDPRLDLTTATGDSLAFGLLDHTDVLVIPGNRMKKLSDDARRMLDAYRAAGGRVVPSVDQVLADYPALP